MRQIPSVLMRQNGVTLIEVMIAGGLLVMAMLGVASSIEYTNRTVASTRATNDFNTMINLIQGVLNNSNNCTSVLGIFSLDPANTYPLDLSPSILKTNGNSGGTLVQVGNFGGKLNITELQFLSPTAVGGSSTQFVTSLRISATKNIMGSAVGSQTLTHDFPILVTLEPTSHAITHCSGIADTVWTREPNSPNISYLSGNVGIGTDSPDHAFQVWNQPADGGDAKTVSPMVVNMNIKSDTNMPYTNSILTALETTAEFMPPVLHGLSSIGHTGTELRGISGNVRANRNRTLFGTATGVRGHVSVERLSANLTKAVGVNGVVETLASAGLIPLGIGGLFSVEPNGMNPHATAEAVGVQIGRVRGASAYGVRIGTIESALGTTNYSIYAEDSNSPSYFAGGVGIGTSSPQATLDINGYMRMRPLNTAPVACNAAHDAAIAITSGYRQCICKGAAGTWVFTSDGTTACAW